MTTDPYQDLRRALNIFEQNDPALPYYYFDDPPFYSDSLQWACDQESMFNTGIPPITLRINFPNLFRILYFIGDISILREFMSYLLDGQPFQYNGQSYTAPPATGDFYDVFHPLQARETYFQEVLAHHPIFKQHVQNLGQTQKFEDGAKKFLSHR